MPSKMPWARLTAEGVVVVGSILLAFAIDASWNQRRESVIVRELLTSLEGALTANSQLAAARADEVMGDRLLLQRFIGMSPAEAGQIPEDSTWVFLRAIWRSSSASLNTPEVAAILDENPALLRGHPELRAAIAQWRSREVSLARQQEHLTATYPEVLDALAAHEELQPAFAELPGSRVIPGAVAARVRQDEAVMRLASRKVFLSQIHLMFLGLVKEDAERAADLLRARLVRR